MLNMRIEKGRIKYSFQSKKDSNAGNDANLCLTPLPIVYYEGTSPYKKVKLHHWYKKNYINIDDITDILLEAFQAFLETRPVYFVQLDEQLFRQHMVYTLYNNSFNSFKDFP